MSDIFKYGGWIWLSNEYEGDMDLCPHNETKLIRRVAEFEVHRCLRNNCLGFHSRYRSSLEKFIIFIRTLPKLPKVPVEGYYSPQEIARKLSQDDRTILKYSKVIEGFQTDGVLSYIKADSRLFIYRDDPKTNAPPILIGPLSFAAVGGGVTAKLSKGDPFLTALMTFISGVLGYRVEAGIRGFKDSREVELQGQPTKGSLIAAGIGGVGGVFLLGLSYLL